MSCGFESANETLNEVKLRIKKCSFAYDGVKSAVKTANIQDLVISSDHKERIRRALLQTERTHREFKEFFRQFYSYRELQELFPEEILRQKYNKLKQTQPKNGEQKYKSERDLLFQQKTELEETLEQVQKRCDELQELQENELEVNYKRKQQQMDHTLKTQNELIYELEQRLNDSEKEKEIFRKLNQILETELRKCSVEELDDLRKRSEELADQELTVKLPSVLKVAAPRRRHQKHSVSFKETNSGAEAKSATPEESSKAKSTPQVAKFEAKPATPEGSSETTAITQEENSEAKATSANESSEVKATSSEDRNPETKLASPENGNPDTLEAFTETANAASTRNAQDSEAAVYQEQENVHFSLLIESKPKQGVDFVLPNGSLTGDSLYKQLESLEATTMPTLPDYILEEPSLKLPQPRPRLKTQNDLPLLPLIPPASPPPSPVDFSTDYLPRNALVLHSNFLETSFDQPDISSSINDGIRQVQYIRESLESISKIGRDALVLEGEVERFFGTEEDRGYLHLKNLILGNLIKLDDIDDEGQQIIKQRKREEVKNLQELLKKLRSKCF